MNYNILATEHLFIELSFKKQSLMTNQSVYSERQLFHDMVLPKRYSKEQIYRAFRNPQKFINEARYIYASSKFKYKYGHKNGANPLLEDWDNLILLDACRYDMLKKSAIFDEEVRYKILRSSTSPEFCDEYIYGNNFHDTIYVTANPFGARVNDGIFYNKHSTTNVVVENMHDSWDPETVYQLAVENYKENRNKRMLVHFMQPHSPYFGEKAEKLRDELREEGYTFWAWNEELTQEDKNREDIITHLLSAAQTGLISVDDLTDIYLENIEVVAEYVKKLASEIGGKTIVSSDHGEMLKWKIGHGRDINTEGLRKVPWVVLDYEQRRETYREEPQISQEIVESDVDTQLGALGYI
jgi:hypothetical protein